MSKKNRNKNRKNKKNIKSNTEASSINKETPTTEEKVEAEKIDEVETKEETANEVVDDINEVKENEKSITSDDNKKETEETTSNNNEDCSTSLDKDESSKEEVEKTKEEKKQEDEDIDSSTSQNKDKSSKFETDSKENVEDKKEEKKKVSFFHKKEKKEIKKWTSIPFILYSFISLSIMMLLSEYIFKTIQFGFLFDVSLLRITLFSLGFSGIVACLLSLLPLKPSRIINTIICFIIPIYALFQIGIYNMMHSYTTLKTAGGMAGAMGGYVLQYIRQMPIPYWFILIIPFTYFFISKKLDIYKSKNIKNLVILLVSAIALDEGGLLLMALDGDFDQYEYPTYQETAIREYGIERFLIRDIATIFSEKDASIEQEEYTKIDSTREIDDTTWTSLSEKDDNEDRKTVDNYLMNRNVDGYNEKTGLLEGKNLIYIMIEAWDYIGIDKELTPTLYKMQQEGWDFSNHYTPKFDTGTSDSELISETSLVPRRDMNVYAEFSSNDWTDSIFSIFNAQGYSTHAYHNWTDEFYPRKTMMESLYCEDYEDYDDLPFKMISGWQSDYDLFRFTTDKYINEDKFMTMYITSSTHFPYNTTWDVLGNKYLDQINKVHPDYPEDVKHYISKAMELDKGMEYLLETLEDAGKLDDTAIVFFADHHPLNMNVQYLIDCTTQVDRSTGMNEFRSPFVIYCPSLLGDETFTNVSSTYDILPTVLNLYDMDYDPRLYLGTDYFSDTESIVYFPDGDWLTDKGIYYASTSTFEATTDEVVTDSYIQNNTSKTNNAFNISYLIYTTDYFHYRSQITTPDDDMPDFEIITDPETGEEIRVVPTASAEATTQP